MAKNEVIEAAGKFFIYRAQPLPGLKNKYMILRGKNINGEFVEYSNMFANKEDRQAKTFKSPKEAAAYIKTLARLENVKD